MRSCLLALLVCVSAVSAVSAQAPSGSQAPLPYTDPVQPHIPEALLYAIAADQTAGRELLYCAEGVVADGTSARYGSVPYVQVQRLRVGTRFADCKRPGDVGFIVVTSQPVGDGQIEFDVLSRALSDELPNAFFGAVAYTVIPIPHILTGEIVDFPRMLLSNRRIDVTPPRRAPGS